MIRPTLYVASIVKHAQMWRDLRAALEPSVRVTSTWLDAQEPVNYPALWDKAIREASSCNFLIAYHEPDDQWKGVFIEIGAALASSDTQVMIVGDPPGSWIEHDEVPRYPTIGDAITDIIGRRV